MMKLLIYPDWSRAILLLLAMVMPSIGIAAEKVVVGSAKWNSQSGNLAVKGRYPASLSGSRIELVDSSGRLLASGTAKADGKFAFTEVLPRTEMLCSVRLRVGDKVAERKVQGVSGSPCKKVPQCQILSPAGGINVKANENVSFNAKAVLRDKKAGPLRLEWDFGGGSMGEEVSNGSLLTTWKRPDATSTTVQFVRDNSRYRVRFHAMDGNNRLCEDSIEVTVGSPPEVPPGVGLMVANAARNAPGIGSQLASSVVTLPFPGISHVEATDSRFVPRLEVPYSYGPCNALNVQVFRKARLPVLLTDEEVKLTYSASSNPADPVGSVSINTTSQNWPLSSDLAVPSLLAEAAIAKTDM